MHATAHAGITLESIPAARPELVTGRRHKPEGCSKAGQFCIFHPQFLSDAPRKLPEPRKVEHVYFGSRDEINTHL